MREGWTRVAFGDVVQVSRERTSVPSADGLDRYVGLEHLDPGDLKIRRWGNVADGTTFTSVFRPGQVLFGKRRAYQRKVAVSDFSGVCSGDIYVFEPRTAQLDPLLLPFLCSSDHFFRHALQTSAGSLSPRTSWDRLAELEFLLPPQHDQQRLACVLTAAQQVIDAHLVLHQELASLRHATVLRAFAGGVGNSELVLTDLGLLPRTWTVAPLVERYEVQLGKMMSESARSGSGQVPYLRNANVQWNRLDLSDVSTMAATSKEREKFALRPGDILACEGRHVGKSAIWRDEIPGAIYQKALHRIRARSDRDSPSFMLHCLWYYSATGRFVEQTAETTIPHLSAERLQSMLFPFPPREEQDEIAMRISDLDTAASLLSARVADARLMVSRALEATGW